MSPGESLLRVENLVKHYPVTAGVLGRAVAAVKAVDGVSFEIERGRTLGLVGESGCGKSTVGRCVLQLEAPTSGRVFFEGREITGLEGAELRPIRRELQIVFQDPFSSLNPRMTVADIVGEALRVHGIARGREAEERVVATLAKVGIPQAWINRYPHEFSGGQRQRISIARAIAVDPKLVVCDEAVSALDVSIQAQVLNLLVDLRRELGLSYLFISHDLSVVRHVSDDVAVMYLGQLVERAPAETLFERPAHPYTRALLSAIPMPDPTRRSERTVLEGDVPTPLDPPSGCRFHTRCPAATERCSAEVPPDVDLGEGHHVACVHADGLAGQGIAAQPVLNERIAAAEAARSSVRAARRSDAREVEDCGMDSGDEERAAVRKPDEATPAAPVERGDVDESSKLWPPRIESIGVACAAVACLFAISRAFVPAALLGGVAWLLLGSKFVERTPSDRPGAPAEDGATRPWIVAVGLATVVALSGFVGISFEKTRQFQRADAQLAALHEEIARFEALRGRVPTSLDEIGWRVSLALDGSDRDPWGRRWRYVQPGADGRAYDLGSVGPDGTRGSADDVGELGTGDALPLSPKAGDPPA